METIYKPLVVNTINDLADKDFTNSAPLVEGFLPSEGAFLFCGSSKIGKSWLALYLALRVSTGEKFWDLDVKKTSVLYLCLEDGERRLRDRLFSIASEYPDNFYYSTEATTIDTTLIPQLEDQMKEHPDIGLIIIDTLAAIRCKSATPNGNVFYDDYRIIKTLQEFALKHNNTVLLIHHVRKTKSSDPFEDISGSNGLHVASDGAFVMRRENAEVKLYTRHRDMAEHVYTIDFNKAECIWHLIDDGTPAEEEFKTDPDLRKVIEYMNEHDEYYGLAQEFCDMLGLKKKAQSISGKLMNRKYQLEKMGILFEKNKTRAGSVITLLRINNDIPVEADDESEEEQIEDLPYEILDVEEADPVTMCDEVTTLSGVENVTNRCDEPGA